MHWTVTVGNQFVVPPAIVGAAAGVLGTAVSMMVFRVLSRRLGKVIDALCQALFLTLCSAVRLRDFISRAVEVSPVEII